MKKIVEVKKEQDRSHIIKKIIVNTITGLRVVGTFAMIPITFKFGFLTAGIAALLFLITDFLDGQFARGFKVQSFFGSLLDGISDKLFAIVCLLILATKNPIFYTIILSEILILYTNYKSIQRGNNAQSSIPGKAKTALMATTIVSSFLTYEIATIQNTFHFNFLNKLNNINLNTLTTILAIPTLIACLYVFGDYNIRARKQEKNREYEEEKNIKKIEEEKTKLKEQKKKLEEKKKFISKDELMYRLFDTDFYLEHRNDPIKKLLYK